MINLTLRKLFQILIRIYQLSLSPLLTVLFGTRCRFYPSCSHFAMECLNKQSLPKAVVSITGRLAKCGPWHPGGVDFP